MTFKPTGIRASSIVGRAAAPAEDKLDGKITELRLAIGHGYKDKQTGEWKDTGTTWLTYTASGDWAQALKSVGKGDLVEISDASVETRTFTRKDGTEGLGVQARFGNLEILEAKGEGAKSSESPW
jgi:hypothetical protein